MYAQSLTDNLERLNNILTRLDSVDFAISQASESQIDLTPIEIALKEVSSQIQGIRAQYRVITDEVASIKAEVKDIAAGVSNRFVLGEAEALKNQYDALFNFISANGSIFPSGAVERVETPASVISEPKTTVSAEKEELMNQLRNAKLATDVDISMRKANTAASEEPAVEYREAAPDEVHGETESLEENTDIAEAMENDTETVPTETVESVDCIESEEESDEGFSDGVAEMETETDVEEVQSEAEIPESSAVTPDEVDFESEEPVRDDTENTVENVTEEITDNLDKEPIAETVNNSVNEAVGETEAKETDAVKTDEVDPAIVKAVNDAVSKALSKKSNITNISDYVGSSREGDAETPSSVLGLDIISMVDDVVNRHYTHISASGS